MRYKYVMNKKIYKLVVIVLFFTLTLFKATADDNKVDNTIIGNANAKITVKEYLSLTCSHCSNFHTKTFPRFKKDFIDTGLIKFELIDYPLDRLAMIASAIVKSLPEESYFDTIDILLKNQKKWAYSKDPINELTKVSKMFGITEDKFKNILSNRELMQRILNRMESENSKFDIQSTPTFIINDRHKITGYLSYDDFKKKLKEFGLIE